MGLMKQTCLYNYVKREMNMHLLINVLFIWIINLVHHFSFSVLCFSFIYTTVNFLTKEGFFFLNHWLF